MSRRLKTVAMALVAIMASSVLVAPTPAMAAAKTVTDKKATLVVTPADGRPGNTGKVTATFTKSHRVTNRPVRLEVKKSGKWAKAAEPVKMTAKGVATFALNPSPTATYRAVADAHQKKPKAVTKAAKSKLLIDKSAKITVTPVIDGKNVSVKVDFTKSYTVKNRPVQFQMVKSNKWVNVGKPVKMNSSGVATLKSAPSTPATYRAVAAVYKKKLKATTLPAASAWKLERNYDFDSNSSLNKEWTTWQAGEYTVRKCAANSPSNVTMKDGYATLRLTKTTSPATLAKAKAAGCTTADTYANSMVYTNGSFTMKTGIVAARVKFPKNQSMHGGIWLSPASASPEIDIIESYGYAGKNSYYSKTTSGIHQAMTAEEHAKLVAPKGWEKSYGSGLSQTVFNIRRIPESWYKAYHVVSVEFTTTKLIFRIDGKVTGTLNRQTPVSDYFLVMSLITTQWELNQAKSPLQTPASMSVDWVRAWVKK